MPQWLFYALLSAGSAALVGILGKIGMKEIDSNLATAVRSVVMTAFLLSVCTLMGVWEQAAVIACPGGRRDRPLRCGRGRLVAVLLPCDPGGNGSQVAPIDKLSMPLAVVLAVLILGDRPTLTNWMGIALIAGGAYLAALPART